jgi:hypothetical protein
MRRKNCIGFIHCEAQPGQYRFNTQRLARAKTVVVRPAAEVVEKDEWPDIL